MASATPAAVQRPQRVRLTMRQDAWWLPSLLTFLGLSSFIVYATWAALQNAHYTFGNYLSPMYSPELFGDSPHAWFGPKPSWFPDFLPFSPALLILWAPGGFRFTCYYYRGAYYKAFWADPPSCAVGEPRKSYLGENSFPLIIQNIHRYFLYLALLFLVFLAYDAYKALWFANPSTGAEELGLGVGSLVIAANVVFLSSYTFGCHSLRHLIGGYKDELGKDALRSKCYSCVSSFNRRHMLFAWISLFGVMFADLYVRLCSMGIWTDWRIL
jgi:hypothetical protein